MALKGKRLARAEVHSEEDRAGPIGTVRNAVACISAIGLSGKKKSPLVDFILALRNVPQP